MRKSLGFIGGGKSVKMLLRGFGADAEVREAFRRRLIDLYRRYKPELMESTSTRLR
jgi:hypothetical protein